FEFTPASDLSGALAAAPGAQGLLLDLDFRRTDPARLVDESGAARAQRGAGERARLSEVQGILILRALRSRGVRLPALLCADLDDAERTERLQSDLAPLEIVPGSEGVFAREHERRALAAPEQVLDTLAPDDSAHRPRRSGAVVAEKLTAQIAAHRLARRVREERLPEHDPLDLRDERAESDQSRHGGHRGIFRPIQERL